MRKLLSLSFLVLLLLVGLMPTAAQSDSAFIRVGHFSADAPEVDIYLNGELSAVEGLAYGSVTPWMGVPAGTYTVDVVPTGEGVDASVYQAEVELTPGSWTTLSAIGTVSGGTLRVQPALEDFRTPIAGGEARFTLFHGIEGMSGIDLVRNGVVLISTVTHPDPALGNDGAASVELAAGVNTYTVTGAGRTSAVLVTLEELEVPAGSYVSVFTFGTLEAPLYVTQVVSPEDVETVRSGGTLEDEAEAEVTTTEATAEATEAPETTEATPAPTPVPVVTDTPAYIRVAHVADAPEVDIYLNGELSAAAGLETGDVTAWTVVEAGTVVVDVVPVGEGVDASVYQAEVELEEDSWTTLSALGSIEGDTFRVQPAVEDFSTAIAGGEARFTLFHGITGMSGIDLVRNGVVLISTVTYPDPALGNDGAASVELAAGLNTYQVTGAGRTSAVIVTLEETDVVAGTYFALFVYGTLEAPLYTVAVTTPEDVAAIAQ